MSVFQSLAIPLQFMQNSIAYNKQSAYTLCIDSDEQHSSVTHSSWTVHNRSRSHREYISTGVVHSHNECVIELSGRRAERHQLERHQSNLVRGAVLITRKSIVVRETFTLWFHIVRVFIFLVHTFSTNKLEKSFPHYVSYIKSYMGLLAISEWTYTDSFCLIIHQYAVCQCIRTADLLFLHCEPRIRIIYVSVVLLHSLFFLYDKPVLARTCTRIWRFVSTRTHSWVHSVTGKTYVSFWGSIWSIYFAVISTWPPYLSHRIGAWFECKRQEQTNTHIISGVAIKCTMLAPSIAVSYDMFYML